MSDTQVVPFLHSPDVLRGDTGEFFITDNQLVEFRGSLLTFEAVLREEAISRKLEVFVERDIKNRGVRFSWKPADFCPGLYS